MCKRLSYVVSTVLCAALFLGKMPSVYAAENTMQYQVTDVDTLIEMAENNIDDFAEDTGIEFAVDCEKQALPQSGAAKLMNLQSDDEYEVNVYRTSQYLGEIENENGELDKIYALHGITTYRATTPSDTKSNGGCTIKTTLYIQWGTGNTIEFKLLRSSATISGTLKPTSLKMENCVYEGWGYDNHYNTQTISYPSNTTYNLYPSFSGYISQYSAYCGAEDTVSFGDGGTLKTSVYFDA